MNLPTTHGVVAALAEEEAAVTAWDWEYRMFITQHDTLRTPSSSSSSSPRLTHRVLGRINDTESPDDPSSTTTTTATVYPYIQRHLNITSSFPSSSSSSSSSQDYLPLPLPYHHHHHHPSSSLSVSLPPEYHHLRRLYHGYIWVQQEHPGGDTDTDPSEGMVAAAMDAAAWEDISPSPATATPSSSSSSSSSSRRSLLPEYHRRQSVALPGALRSSSSHSSTAVLLRTVQSRSQRMAEEQREHAIRRQMQGRL